MAAAHSTLKARSGRNPPLKTGAPKSENRAKAPARGPRQPANQGRRWRSVVRASACEGVCSMIRAEMFNLEKAASVLRCLVPSMDTRSVDGEPPYYPDVVEVAGDLIERSLADLDVLYDGYIPNPLLAGRKIERL
jgi:hypothetical protein